MYFQLESAPKFSSEAAQKNDWDSNINFNTNQNIKLELFSVCSLLNYLLFL